MQETCRQVLAELGENDPLFKLALELEKIALEDHISLRESFIQMLIFTLGLPCGPWGYPKRCLHVFLRWHELMVGYHNGKK